MANEKTNTDPIYASGLLELVGKDEKIDQNDFSGSVAVPISLVGKGGIIRSVMLVQDPGSGDLLSVAGELLFFSADPNPTSGDTDLTLAEWKTLVGKLTVAAGDWVSGAANGQIAFFANVDIAVPNLANLYAVFKLTSATSINSIAGDDEVLSMNVFVENLRNQG